MTYNSPKILDTLTVNTNVI